MAKRKGKKSRRASRRAAPSLEEVKQSRALRSAPGTAFRDEHLLEESRTRWQYGEWNELIALDRARVEQDSERAKLILLVAAAHSQAGDMAHARSCARQALHWGCDRRLAARLLISATYNSLARTAVALDDDLAAPHFREALRLVEPRADARLLGQTRRIRETARLGLLPEAAKLIDADLATVREAPADYAARMQILESELELLRGEISQSLQRSQLYRADAADSRPETESVPALQGQSFAQLEQDLWVLERTGYKRGGYFVDFGATDGVSLNNTYLLETEYGWTGLCAEPNPAFFKMLKQNRPCRVSDACIGARTGEEVEFILADVFGGIANFASSDSHADKRAAYRADGRVVRMRTVSLEDFLRQNEAPREIDYMSIDTEGSEYNILAAFPFDRWTIRLITVEHNFTPAREAIRALLEEHGYVRTKAKWDDWYELEKSRAVNSQP